MNKVYYFHYRGDSNITFAIQKSGNDILISSAHCNPKDNFCKRIGREIASGRLKAGKCNYFNDLGEVESFLHGVTTSEEFGAHVAYVLRKFNN